MTANELTKERERLGKTQEEMAAHLNGTSVHTYRKWEQGVRKVPVWVPTVLAPRELELGPLSFEELQELDRQAKERGMTIPQLVGDYIRRGIKGGASLLMLCLSAWHLCEPSSDQAARMFARRRDAVDAVEVMGEA
jgi:transcriptional regulator with XRE-family HTH domain